MADEKESLSRLEYDLAEYLIDYQSSHFADIRSFAYKYNNLKISMNPLQVEKPHFFVKFGISEACFSIDTGGKLEGGLGIEDGMVQKWAKRIRVHRELETCWKDLMHRVEVKQSKNNKQKVIAAGNNSKDEINISAILRAQQKKKTTRKRQDEKWGKKKYDKEQ